MNSEWQQVELGDVVTLQRGFDLPTRNRVDGSVPIVSSSGITGYHNEAKVESPGVVTGRYGTLGEVFYITEDFWPLNTTLFAKDFHGNDRRFVSYLLESLDLAAYNSASSVPGVNRNTLHRIPVLLPPLPIQRRIAGILGALDDKIEVNRRINRTLEEMAQTLYKHWFVDFGPFQDGEFVDSELGPIPKGWQVQTLLEVCELLSGGTPKTKVDEYWNGDILWVSAKDVSQTEGVYLLDTERKITRAGVENSSTKVLPAGTVVIIARGATTGRLAMLGRDMAMNQTCYGLRAKGKLSQPWAYLTTSWLVFRLQKLAYGSIFDSITTATFRDVRVALATPEVMKRFDEKVSPLFEIVYANTLENHKLAETRDYLLPKLLSGEVEVPAAEAVVEGRPAGPEGAEYEQPALL